MPALTEEEEGEKLQMYPQDASTNGRGGGGRETTVWDGERNT